MYVTWTGDVNAYPNGLINGTGDWNIVPTTWTQVVQINGRVNTATGMAGINMTQNVFNGQQFYVTGYSTSSGFLDPNLFETRNFTNAYVNRVYGNTYGWSQCGTFTAATLTQAPVSWVASVNTSVWDTIGGTAAAISSAAAIASLRIHSGARLMIIPGGQVTCTGPTEINEPRGLWITSDVTGTGSFIDNGTITYNTGSVMVQRYLDPDKWHGYFKPFTQRGTNPYIGYYMKWYNNTTHTYRYVIDPTHSDSLLNVGIGYMMWSSSSTPISPIGQLNTGNISLPVTRPPYPGAPGFDYDDWNLIGNPYPSAVNLGSGNITWNNVIQEAYFWNPGSGNWTTYIKAGGSTHTQYAPAQQGFFVRHDTTITAATSFTYVDNTVRTHNTEAFLKEDLADMLQVSVFNSANSYLDLGIVRFAEGTTSGLDENIDALKLAGDANAPQMFFPVPGDHNLHITVLPWTGINQVVPMGFSFSIDASVTITTSNMESFGSGTRIYLEDKKEVNTQELTVNPAYTFTASPNDDPNRFVLHFYNPAFGVEDKNLAGMQIYSFEEYVYVRNLVKGTTRGTIQIYDLLGRKVFQGNLKDMELNKYLPGVNEGYFMVRVVTEGNSYTQKVYLK